MSKKTLHTHTLTLSHNARNVQRSPRDMSFDKAGGEKRVSVIETLNNNGRHRPGWPSQSG